MADASKIGTDWQADELDAIVADYFAMLAAEQAGVPYVKSHHAQALMARIGRTHRSVEFKHMNLSAVLSELGLPTIRGYKPKPNYQHAIFAAIDRYLAAHDDAWTPGDDRLPPLPSASPSLHEAPTPFSSPFNGEGDHDPKGSAEPELVEGAPPSSPLIQLTDPPPLGQNTPRPEGLQRLVRKFDPAARDARNRRLGLSGEHQVFHFERARLAAADRPDLARKVEWTSRERGDGAGYDIRSFDPDGAERFIEVKTTRGGPRTDFFLSRNERAFSQEEPERFRLYRLYDFGSAPAAEGRARLFALKPPLEQAVRLEAEVWRAGLGFD